MDGKENMRGVATVDDIRFGESGLIPAIAQDVFTGRVLMQAFVNRDALLKSVETGLATYYSRSRKSLWVKGGTSGHVQRLKKIMLDCDLDSVLYVVEQTGVPCHTGADSCFFNELKAFERVPDYKVVFDVDSVIRSRKTAPVEGSYTNYLFAKGVEKICKKLGEETTETVIAATLGKRAETVAELSDLLYHALVLMANEDIALAEVFSELEERHGRPPEQKASRRLDG